MLIRVVHLEGQVDLVRTLMIVSLNGGEANMGP